MKKYGILAISVCIILTAVLITGCGKKPEPAATPQYQQNPEPIKVNTGDQQEPQKIIPRSIPESKPVRTRVIQRIIPSSINKNSQVQQNKPYQSTSKPKYRSRRGIENAVEMK